LEGLILASNGHWICVHMDIVSGSDRALILKCRAGSIKLLIKDFENAACSKVVNLVVFVC
jgi:hypothetical protein